MFKPGDYVYIHKKKLVKQHIPCRVVDVAASGYVLCTYKGVLARPYTGEVMTGGRHAKSIPLDNWHQSSRVSLDDVMNDTACLEICRCTLSESSLPTVVVSDDSDDPLTPTSEEYWVVNLLYRLTKREREMIRSPVGWLNDSIIYARCQLPEAPTLRWRDESLMASDFNIGFCILSTLIICMHLTPC